MLATRSTTISTVRRQLVWIHFWSTGAACTKDSQAASCPTCVSSKASCFDALPTLGCSRRRPAFSDTANDLKSLAAPERSQIPDEIEVQWAHELRSSDCNRRH